VAAGNVVLEAQASGLQVLVSEDGGRRELMRPGITGIGSREPRSVDARHGGLPDAPAGDRRGYQKPRTRHQARPMVSQMARFTAPTTAPVRHHSPNVM
jgi:hypothetical protein